MKYIDISKFPYAEIRKSQKGALKVFDENWDKYKYYICEFSTGMGKSALAKTVCSSVDKAFIITSTKQLQDQYINDFRGNDIVSIKGKANYKCSLNSRLNCESGYCLIDKKQLAKCKIMNICPYYNVRDRAMCSNITLTSYQYFLRAIDCAGFWKPRDVIVFDECHLLESQIVQWATLKLSPRELIEKYKLIENNNNFQDICRITTPPENPGYKENEMWILTLGKMIFDRRNEKFKEIQSTLKLSSNNPDSVSGEELDLILSTHKDYYELDKFYKKLDVFIKDSNKDDWMVELYEDGLELTPLNIQKLFKAYLDKMGVKKIIFMSATILDLPLFRKTFGLEKDDTLLIRSDSEFDASKSPIIYKPVCKMNYDELNKNLDKIVETVKEILDNHPNEKGIIHTGNSTISRYLQENINSDRLLVRFGDVINNEIIKQHNKSNKPTVLVSSSLTEGVDLKGDLSRFQIIVKLPFLSLADKRISEKIKKDNDWYVVSMFRSLIQQCGRSTRNKEDFSITYVLDLSFKWWLTKNKTKGWFQPQFLKRIIWDETKFNYEQYKNNRT